ncbi:hypothetical protein H9Q69_011889 [Fusarium xylarioides]|nr:hypothetical protein H9Q69_011889 [Fusarium xylarioides]
MAVTIPSPSFKVALVQMKPKPLDAEHNFAHAAEQIRVAADQGAALAVLPEYHLTGWVPEEPSFALSPEDAGKYRKKYQDLAAELHINICAGTFVSQAPKSDDQQNTDARPTLLNTSDFIDHNGNLLGTYTKTNLWIPERHTLTSFVDHAKNISKDDYAAPNPHQVIDTPLGRVGAKIIIIPSYWTALDMCKDGLAYNADCERMFIQSALVTRAFENTAAVIYCNAGGPAAEGFFGCSQVALPIVGTVSGSFTDGEEAMRILDVDMKTVDIAERNYQIRQDLARDDWHYWYLKNTVARL